MSRTYKKPHNSKLFRNGERGHHNSLLREFKEIGWCVKDARNLIDERNYQSDRLRLARRVVTEKRRQALKRKAERMIEEELNDE